MRDIILDRFSPKFILMGWVTTLRGGGRDMPFLAKKKVPKKCQKNGQIFWPTFLKRNPHVFSKKTKKLKKKKVPKKCRISQKRHIPSGGWQCFFFPVNLKNMPVNIFTKVSVNILHVPVNIKMKMCP